MQRLLLSSLLTAGFLFAQVPDAGKAQYEGHCAVCHGRGAAGGELGPPILTRIGNFNDAELGTLIHEGLPASGMPRNELSAPDTQSLVAYLRTLARDASGAAVVRQTVTLKSGKKLTGAVLNQGPQDMQLLNDADHRTYLLRRDGTAWRQVTSERGWTTYHGGDDGNRYSTLQQINKSNISKLAPKWVFQLRNTSPLLGTPLVVDGIMYMTSANECYALDAGTGREIWHYLRRRTRGLVGNAAGGINRGAALAGDRVFMTTDNAHLIALDRFNGKLLWETELADWRQNYNGTAAPLIVGNLVISGTAGGDEGARGFIAAYDQATGKEAWRFWTVPRRGEPGSETWQGDDIDHPASTTWLTGTYDAALDTIYWPTGNPGPDLNGDKRGGDNLYSSSIVALDAKTGKLKWYFQYTPHNVWDWDAQQPPVLVDTTWKGQPRKLLLHANRNGYFYVLDRTNGKMLLAKQYVKKLNWSKGIDANGRPIVVPDMEPTAEGKTVCPSLQGGSNWFSTSYNPATKLYYVQTLEKCSSFTKTAQEWKAGTGYFGGSFGDAPGDVPQKILRALNIETGEVTWELPQTGNGGSWGGVLSTASGVVFFCDDSGAFAAADTVTGKSLWSFPANQSWKASPITYQFDGKQYVAVASGSNLIAFGLVE